MTVSPTPRPRPPQPVALAPVAALVERAPDVARGWLLALLDAAPLEALGALPAAEFARHAPELCAAVARALADEEALARLGPGGDLADLAAQSARLAGAGDAAGALGAVDALREVTWAAAWRALDDPSPEEAAELARRLGQVCGVVAAAAVSARDVARPATGHEPPGRGEPPDREPSAARPGAAGFDGLPWVSELEQRVAAGRPFALLLAELEDLHRLTAGEAVLHVETLHARLARAVRAEVGRPDVVAWEDGGRAWVIADGLGRGGAESLARRIAEAVRAMDWRGAPLLASIGFSLHPQDATDAEALVEAAEEGVFAARSAGRGVGAPG